jgi:hypothetical protein
MPASAKSGSSARGARVGRLARKRRAAKKSLLGACDRLGKVLKPRSVFEVDVIRDLLEGGVLFEYESTHLEYTVKHRYTPDLVLCRPGGYNFAVGFFVEVKGKFTPADRTKTLAVLAANPGMDLRFLFQRDNKLNPKSKTRYSDWCEKHGIQYSIGRRIPSEWIR